VVQSDYGRIELRPEEGLRRDGVFASLRVVYRELITANWFSQHGVRGGEKDRTNLRTDPATSENTRERI
jgi:hypothetical protein